jgi:flagellar motor protein MotB
MLKPVTLRLTLCLLLVAASAEAVSADTSAGTVRESAPLGATVEKQLPLYEKSTQWVQDDSEYEKSRGDRIEKKEVLENELKTVKLHNVIPPIHYGSGNSQIPESYIGRLRAVLKRMKDRRNVRLHFIGHTDNVQLRGALKKRYGDNIGLSRERAGYAAEYFQRALGLPPESISYDGVGDTQPLASNATSAGRAQNRRVEVEVWYDEVREKQVAKDVVVSEKLNRIKVCRVETVCKLTYKDGYSKRARIKNLVPPLRYEKGAVTIPDAFRRNVLQALNNLKDRQNVVVKLIAYTDNAPLSGRDERIYGDNLGLSKAVARRAALALQDALKLPSTMIDSDGRGSAHPIASNETELGRSTDASR